MRVAVITPAAPEHHLQFCADTAARHELVAVIHPSSAPEKRFPRAKRKLRRFTAHGLTYGALQAAAVAPSPLMGWNWTRALAAAESRFFADAAAAYAASGAAAVARPVADVNDASTRELLARLAPDAVVCLGGPVYRTPLIEACKLMVNFHSGISPLYNGASSIFFAFANGHPHLCGGTLMTMSPAVDGGDVLAHYLPEIEPDDDPASLFAKTVRAAGPLCASFLADVEAGGPFSRVPQSKPLFYYTTESWTVHQTQRIRRELERGTAARHVRPEAVVPYWRCRDDDEARARLRETLAQLLELP